MILFQLNRIQRRFGLLMVALILAGLALSGTSATAEAAPSSAPVNVPALILYAGGCYGILQNTAEVDFYYYKLDGTIGGRAATVDNGGLTYNTGVPTIQFYQLSFNYAKTTSLYEFVAFDNSYLDIYAEPRVWGRDSRNGNIFGTLPC